MKSLPAQVTDVVWLQTGFIGDVVLSTGAFALARAKFPAARHHLITTAVAAGALKGSGGFASLVVFDKKGGFLRSFRAVRAALAPQLASRAGAVLLQPHLSHRSGLLARFLGLPTINYDESAWGGYAAARVPRVAVLNEAARVALLLGPLGLEREEIAAVRPNLDPAPWREDLLPAGPERLVAIAPGSVWGTKRWLPAGYLAVARGLLARHVDVRLVFVGAPAEGAVVDEILAGLSADERLRTANLAGKTSLYDLRGLFPRLALLVANDSSPLHFAAAFDVPTVAVFGATVPAMGFGPLATRREVLGVELGCRPCGDHGPQVCPLGHFRCMRDLPPAAVLAACERLLA